MIKIKNIEIWGFEHAIRGMRNPMNSWDKSDSIRCYANGNCPGICKNNACGLCVGDNDFDLMKRLYKAGTEHRKYLRQIIVSMDITAPLYWWKEFDTYKVGTVANSCSTMHKIATKEFTLDDFSHEHLFGNEEERDVDESIGVLNILIDALNVFRNLYIEEKERGGSADYVKYLWWQMIQLLPSSYNQKRTVTMNYENVVTMIRQRTGHKLDEWNSFVAELRKLPYIEEIIGDD